jgi:DNA-binding response OmpR family regulator
VTKKILIVEDSPAALILLKSILEKEGYLTIEAENGEDGLKKAKEEKPDLVITDTLLPGIDGFEVCRQIKQIQIPTSPKVIMMTGSVDAVDAVKARKVGADDYCAKTRNFMTIIEAVKKLI